MHQIEIRIADSCNLLPQGSLSILMKAIILNSLFASIAVAVTARAAQAAPSLRLDTTILHGERTLSRPTMLVSNGEKGSIVSGSRTNLLEYTVSPTLLNDGRVDIKAVVTYRNGKSTDELATHFIARQGKAVEVQQGALTYRVTPTLDKPR